MTYAHCGSKECTIAPFMVVHVHRCRCTCLACQCRMAYEQGVREMGAAVLEVSPAAPVVIEAVQKFKKWQLVE